MRGPVVKRPISANPGLNFNPSFFFFCSKVFSRVISSFFRASNHQIVGRKNKTEFAININVDVAVVVGFVVIQK